MSFNKQYKSLFIMRRQLLTLFVLFFYVGLYAQSDLVNEYSISWDSPSENSSGSMPIGNGEFGANVWMERNGNLVFFLSRTDSWSENAALYKLGKIRMSFNPLEIGADTKFRQYLDLKNGRIDFEIMNGADKVNLTFMVDAYNPSCLYQRKFFLSCSGHCGFRNMEDAGKAYS